MKAAITSSLAILATFGLASCAESNPEGSARIAVESSNDACTLSTNTAPAGTIVFKVKNTGDKSTEFYMMAEDGVEIIGEVENIAPGLSRDLTVEVEAGNYQTLCKPGAAEDKVGEAEFVVTE